MVIDHDIKSIMEEKRIHLDIAYTRDDFKKWIHLYNNRISYIWVTIPCVLLFIVLILLSAIRSGFSAYNIALLLLFCSILILIYLVWYVFPLSGFTKGYLDKNQSKLEITEVELQFTSDVSKQNFKWHAYKYSFETRDMLILLEEVRRVVILPKRFFSTVSEIDWLRQIIESKSYIKYRRI